MSITMPRLRRDTRAPRHKAADEVRRLRHQLDGAGLLITGLRQQVTEARDAEDRANAKAVRVDEAEARATAAEQQAAVMDAELQELRAFKANATATSIPAGHRDVDPDDQPTHPTGIHVQPLWDALNVGPVHAVTNPGQTTWGAHNQQQEVA